jgi:sugar (pentulose or hexulose) kinase
MVGPQRGEASLTHPSVTTPSAPGSAEGVLAVDVGGGGVRAGFFGWDGSLRSLVTSPPPSDGEQFNPDWTWLAVAAAIRGLTSRRIQVRAPSA